ncbi:hypothetical protein [Neisseria iguanae]|uniref:Uncharacterized protein n=1 Tax=Neisseria iguanae TaxID=90242 RepID=A0A2P7U032_9NEIS|nr:hypothetical protein [Neisseria iguanae]PSJ80340.1 hypothetical protein C7N83_06860 [Neisseria iguanae]
MKYSENVLNILTTKTFKSIGDAWVNKHLKTALSYEAIVELLKVSSKDPVSEEAFIARRDAIEKQINLLGNYCDGAVAIGDT